MHGVERVADPTNALAWLRERSVDDGLTGYDAGGWPASAWVLHAMYENESLPANVTHDDLRKRGLIPPLIIGDVNLDEGTTVTGTPLGYVIRPGTQWRRLRWSEMASRLGAEVELDHEFPPSQSWLPIASFPVNIAAPPEGSLDEESWFALVEFLASNSPNGPETMCTAYYTPLVQADLDSRMVLRGPLHALAKVVEDESIKTTPSNIWPDDRSWFVWTDWDLWGTKVSGTADLIAGLQSVPALEIVDWQMRR